ncbi:MAG: sulfurtransferase [Silvanigrellales bacterium]|nr:sulfurtransferase [Silvanigrellales bacterium]
MRACELSAQELAVLLDTRKNEVLLVDVRESWEFELTHLPGSLLLGETNMEDVFARARRSKEVVLVCHHGLRSLNATLFFRQNGVTQARSLRGGVDAFAREVDATLPRY